MSAHRTAPLAINGGEPVRPAAKAWPSWPVFGNEERAALLDVFESGRWFYGERVARFEREYAAFQGAKHCVSCANGTAAAEIVLQALGVRPGDEVIVPPYTFIATASCVARFGAFPVFVDVDDSWNLDPAQAEKAISSKTKAIMPVHFGGRVCDMDIFLDIASRHGIPLIEDACHSWGSQWKGKGTGAIGTCGVFSFQMSKNITAGEGGAILTDDDELAATCRSLVNCGRAAGGQWYEHPAIGTNARMTEFQAAILSAQLTRLEQQTLRREQNAAILNEALSTVPGLTPQPGDTRITRRAYHLYCLKLDPARFGCSREALCRALKAEGVPFGPGYPLPLYRQPAFGRIIGGPSYADCHCPVAQGLCSRSGMWMEHPNLLGSEQDMQDIIAAFEKVKDHAGTLA